MKAIASAKTMANRVEPNRVASRSGGPTMNSRVLLTFAIAVIRWRRGTRYSSLSAPPLPRRPSRPLRPSKLKPAAPARRETECTRRRAADTGNEAVSGGSAADTGPRRAQPATPAADSLRGSSPTIYDIEARSGRRISEPVITVKQGDEVRLGSRAMSRTSSPAWLQLARGSVAWAKQDAEVHRQIDGPVSPTNCTSRAWSWAH